MPERIADIGELGMGVWEQVYTSNLRGNSNGG